MVLTFVALCAAFFAGVVHQSETASHDGAPMVASSVTFPAAPAVPGELASAPVGWLDALVMTCVFLVLAVAVVLARAVTRPRAEQPSADDARRPVADRWVSRSSSARAVPLLLQLSVSRT